MDDEQVDRVDGFEGEVEDLGDRVQLVLCLSDMIHQLDVLDQHIFKLV